MAPAGSEASPPSTSAQLTASPVSGPSPTPLPPATAAGDLASIKATVIPVTQPFELSAVGSTVWAQSGSSIVRIQVASNHGDVIRPDTNGASIDNLVATPTAVWLADFDDSLVVRVDPLTGQTVARIPVGAAEDVLAVGGDIWVTDHHEGTVERIDAEANKVIDQITVGDAGANGPQQLAEGAGSVWVDEGNNHSVIRLDPASGKVIAHISVPDAFVACGGILATDAAVWVTGCHETPQVIRIDPATNKVVATVQLAGYAQDPAQIGDEIWVAVGGRGPHELDRINPKTNKVDRRIDVPAFDDVGGSVIAGGDLWVANGENAILRFPLSELQAP